MNLLSSFGFLCMKELYVMMYPIENMRNTMYYKALVTSMVFVLLAISFVGINTPEALAQGTNATNATNAAGTANATSAAGGGGQNTVVMPLGSSSATGGQGYEPDQVTVSPGATVIWDNQDNALHTATSGNPDTAVPDGKFDSGIVGPNQPSKPVTMPTQPGDYIYFCTLHPFLVGTVTVQ
jgi:plastocyanin